MNKRINHKAVKVELTALQIRALTRLLPNAIMDTGSNNFARAYREVLRKISVASLFVIDLQPPARTPVVVKPDPDGQNARRAEWAAIALDAFQGETGTDDEDVLADLLCDLLHWCDREGYAFKEALRRGKSHYEAETTDPEVANA
jgi:hypothetical protein